MHIPHSHGDRDRDRDAMSRAAGLDAIVADIAAEIARDAATIEEAADRKDPDAAPGAFGIAVALPGGDPGGDEGDAARMFVAGAADTAFPVQSIAKAFALDMAMAAAGDDLFARVGREPSGDPFDSIVDLERTQGVPRNPFVNAGALVVVDVLLEHAGAPAPDAVVGELRRRAGLGDGAVEGGAAEGDPAALDAAVLASERDGGDLNRAMMSFMRHHGNLRSDPEAVMAAYVRQCAVLLDCAGLARAGLSLARTRRRPGDDVAEAAARRRRRVLALMMTCGQYDASGDFALRVGLPAKSGVGGGIVAIVPEVASVAVWSRNLDQNGNSILGVRALEMLAYRTGWSVFGPPLR